MSLARANAKSLATEARLLFDNGFHSRSAALAVLALEEPGKVSVIRDILTAPDSESLRKGWHDYRRHEAKNWMAFFLLYAKPGAQFEDLRPLIENEDDHSTVERVKQNAFYTDKNSDGRWTDPSGAAGRDEAEALLFAAEFACSTPGVFEASDELQLWHEYIGPARGWGLEVMKEAMVACAREGRRRGLLSDLNLDGLEAFLA